MSEVSVGGALLKKKTSLEEGKNEIHSVDI